MKIAAIIQARMGSRRLYGKVSEYIEGKPMLWHIIDRVRRSKLIRGIVISTTTKEVDKEIIEIAKYSAAYSYAGSEDDVLDRYYQTAKEFKVDPIVRITADCPLIDPRVMDKLIQRYSKGDCDYVSNTTLNGNYPDGTDVEVFSFEALETAWKEAKLSSEREHVTPYIQNNPSKFRLARVESDINLSHHRWSVDEKEDLEFVRKVYGHLYKKGQVFYMEDILKLLDKYPSLIKINQHIGINEGYVKSLKEDRIVR